MQFKDIVVQADAAPALEKRVELAARLALHAGARLLLLGAAAEQAEAQARMLGLAQVRAQVVPADDGAALLGASRVADLLVLGQDLPGQAGMSEYIVANAACPALLVPEAGRIFSFGDRILIGWNGSQAAARAVREALPLLGQAQQVHIAAFVGAPLPAGAPGAEALAEYLGAHGIRAQIERRNADQTGGALLALASDLTADLLVMGCTVHPHGARMTGGATRAVLQTAGLPVFLSH